MKYNKVLNDINVSTETKRYVHNYINESIQLMQERGHIDSFIWTSGWTFDNYDEEILELLNSNIITYGNYNEAGILIPISPNYTGVEDDGIVVLVYMLSDEVLLQNGFKRQRVEEGELV